MSKLWSLLLGFSGSLYLLDAVGILYGYKPERFTLFIAFLITGSTVIKWAIEAWND